MEFSDLRGLNGQIQSVLGPRLHQILDGQHYFDVLILCLPVRNLRPLHEILQIGGSDFVAYARHRHISALNGKRQFSVLRQDHKAVECDVRIRRVLIGMEYIHAARQGLRPNHGKYGLRKIGPLAALLSPLLANRERKPDNQSDRKQKHKQQYTKTQSTLGTAVHFDRHKFLLLSGSMIVKRLFTCYPVNKQTAEEAAFV